MDELAAGQGFVTGLGGLITLPASMPTDAAAYVWWLARTASAVQLSYGFPTRTETWTTTKNSSGPRDGPLDSAVIGR